MLLSLVAVKNTESTVFTMNMEESDIPYSNSAVDWQTVVLDIEKTVWAYNYFDRWSEKLHMRQVLLKQQMQMNFCDISIRV